MKTLEDYGNHGCALSWWPISKPFYMVTDTHAHDLTSISCSWAET